MTRAMVGRMTCATISFCIRKKVCIMVLGWMFLRTIWVEFSAPQKENKKTSKRKRVLAHMSL